MNIPNLVGWNFITASQKRHYFLDGRSLCGRFYAACASTELALNQSDVAHFYNCVPCERKLLTGSTRKKRRALFTKGTGQ